MNYGLMTYAENSKTFNIGDYIQSLAAKQFLPRVDEYINREELASFNGEKTKLIMNGWFTHNASNWVPSESINPLIISFHINNTAAPFMLDEKGISYLKKYQPIGCRDYFTVDLLKAKGIEAYFSGCLTLTLDSYRVEDSLRNDDIYIVDPLYGFPNKDRILFNTKTFLKGVLSKEIFEMGQSKQFMKQIFTEELMSSAIYIKQEVPANIYTEDEKFKLAEELLNKYARAKLVITSRIHCALPCLALGTPVIYINGFDSFVDSCRLDGLQQLFNRIDINRVDKKIENNFGHSGKIGSDIKLVNPIAYLRLAEEMKKKCKNFIDD